jgi:hypothetical protein
MISDVNVAQPVTENEDEDDGETDDPQDDEDELTVKKFQDSINANHPFGLKIWKPALYRKSRSVNRTVQETLHSTPGAMPSKSVYLHPGNMAWALLFGWWLSLKYLSVALFILGPLYVFGCFLNLFLKRTRLCVLSDFFLKSGKYIQVIRSQKFILSSRCMQSHQLHNNCKIATGQCGFVHLLALWKICHQEQNPFGFRFEHRGRRIRELAQH